MEITPVDWMARQSWTFSKTRAATNPHWYLVRQKIADNVAFDAMVRHIFTEGVPRVWGGKLYRVWYSPDGHHYWCMGWPVPETTIINRTRTEPGYEQTTAPVEGRNYRWSGPGRGEDPALWVRG